MCSILPNSYFRFFGGAELETMSVGCARCLIPTRSILKFAALILSVFGASGCTTPSPAPVSNNPDQFRVGAKPEGYPRTHIEPKVGFPGYCLKVTESWREDSYNGHVIWLKDKEITSLPCP